MYGPEPLPPAATPADALTGTPFEYVKLPVPEIAQSLTVVCCQVCEALRALAIPGSGIFKLGIVQISLEAKRPRAVRKNVARTFQADSLVQSWNCVAKGSRSGSQLRRSRRSIPAGK